MTEARRHRLARPGVLWLGLCGWLGIGALVGAWLGPARLDWQPGSAAEPWRWWSAAWVHGSSLHLGANLAATALVAAYGWAAGASRAVAIGWFVSWPITHLALWLEPGLLHYGGLSGVLHGGVAAATVELLWRGDRRQRVVGAAVAAGLLAKLWLEQPFGPALHPPGALGVAVAPFAHAAGTVAGAACAALALAIGRRASA